MQIQKSKSRKYIEFVVNTALILVCLILVGALTKKHFMSPAAPAKVVAAGDIISFSDVTSINKQKSLLLFLESRCQYCTKSRNSYDDISKKMEGKSSAKLITLSSDRDVNF